MRKRIIGIIVGAALVLAVSGGNNASAANGWEEELKLVTVGTSSQTSSSVSLSLSSGTIQTDLDAANATTNPDEAGKVLSQTATITVGNTDGYTVYVSGNTNLTGRNNNNHKIPSITSSKTLGSMSNEWGYYGVLGDSEASFNPGTSFKAMTTSQQSVGTGGATSSSVTKKLTLFYGARVNSSAAEDFYGNTVTLSVVAQPGTVTTPITTMQAFDATVCGKLNTHETLQLTDTRDSKKYWVTKMLDGNCWMSQNLDLDIRLETMMTGATNVAASDSDVATDWSTNSSVSAYPAVKTVTSVTTGSADSTGTYSWDLGNYVIIDPTGTTACDGNNTGLSACTGQFVAVGSRTPSSDPNFYKETEYTGTDGSTCTKTANTTYSTATSGACAQYDAHYLAGNYYQWNAATAGTGGTLGSDYQEHDATGSICPKNWKLPNSSSTFNNTSGSFYYLLSQYGVQSSLSGTSEANKLDYNIAQSPLFFVRGGYVDLYYPGAPFRYAGQRGYYWSSRAYSDTTFAYSLYFGSSSVNPSDYYSRYLGFPLRCLIPMS